ncbi:hypothetical protein BLA29_014908 [Euroglyphus maynei]|uniref:Uncharacterized protein n=1 Tax=Euroglyphus maynei TaxID=6958 RepID=A0A1Y3BLN3_EURMA|nr:hypothetical protein BLA29_014908 [Euroglyphus maynei]
MLSSIEGHFIVNDVVSGVSPRISSSSQSPVKIRLGHSAQLLCVTKAWPQATVRYVCVCYLIIFDVFDV